MSIKSRISKLEKDLNTGGKTIFILLGNKDELTDEERRIIEERMKGLSSRGGTYIINYSKLEAERIEKGNMPRKCDLKN